MQLRVAAPPVEGAANAALVAFVASGLELRKGDVRIVSGETGRLKVIELAGEAEALAARLRQWIAGAGGDNPRGRG